MELHFTTLLLGAYCWAFGLLSLYQAPTPLSSISLAIDNLKSSHGNIHIAVYDTEEKFAKSLTPFRLKIHKTPTEGPLQLHLDSLPYGRYALAVYHDENGNGDLDKNLLGIPKEPYGFSNNPRAKWSAPSYEETSFELGAEGLKLAVSLKKWKER